MSVLAKITAVILILIGLLVMLGGVFAGITGAVRGFQPNGVFPNMPMMPGGVAPMMGVGLGLILGGVIFMQGLMLAAVGEALFLIADIARNSRFANRLP